MKRCFLLLTLCLFFLSISSLVIEAEVKEKRRNQVLLEPLLSDNKLTLRDKTTQIMISNCNIEEKDLNKLKKTSNDDVLANSQPMPLCSYTDDYVGSCWVQPVGYLNGRYALKVCNINGVSIGGEGSNCATLGANESKGFFSVQSKTFGLDDVGYQGEYDDDPNLCPDSRNNINALGYAFIEEATDSKYKDLDDFYVNYCEPFAERFYAGSCPASSKCPCDQECKKNGFMPDKKSEEWKKMSGEKRDCYVCHKVARAIRFYCQKVYNCIKSGKVSDSVKNLTLRPENRKYLKYFYGRGSYLCGYYAGQLCGCGKTRLIGGPRHMMRIARNDNRENTTCEQEDTLNNPQCNLFDSKIYVRQFYNKEYTDLSSKCPKNHKAELGYEKRGTFFFPKLIVKSGEHERLVGIDYNLIKDNVLYYLNKPIGTHRLYQRNNRNDYPVSPNIIYSNFYPVIFTIGNSYNTINKDACEEKFSKQLDYFILRYEYNISTDTSSLVAYSIEPSWQKVSTIINSDGSIGRFSMSRTQAVEIENFTYNYDPSNSVEKKTIKQKWKSNDNLPSWPYYTLENIGSVLRPPIKYTYDGSTSYIISPLIIDQDRLSLDDGSDPYSEKVMLKIVPANLKAVNAVEFKDDMKLPAVKGNNITVAGYTSSALDAVGEGRALGANSNALLYMKRFTVGYTDPCKFLLGTMNSTIDPLKPEDDYKRCDNYKNTTDKMACLTISLLTQECQGYLNCLATNTSIAECQNNGRVPNIKIQGNDDQLTEYKMNNDFRSKTFICFTNGFEFADRLNAETGNVRLFGSFGNPKYDYTIRFNRQSKSPLFAHTPTRPLTKRGRNDMINQVNDYLDDPKYITSVYPRYFTLTYENEKNEELIGMLENTFLLDKRNNKPSDVSLLEEYAPECKTDINVCKDRFKISHRLINETQGNLCMQSSSMSGGRWNLQPRDFNVDYHVYIPLRCQYVEMKLYGAGGAGLTTEDNTNCIQAWSTSMYSWHGFSFKIFGKTITIAMLMGMPFGGGGMLPYTHFRTAPKYDSTGGGGGYTQGVLDILKIPVFDGYLSVSIGQATSAVRYIATSHWDGHKCFDGTGENQLSWGQEGSSPWVLRSGSHSYWNTNYSPSYSIQEARQGAPFFKDDDRGNSVVSYEGYGASQTVDESSEIKKRLKQEEQDLKNKLDKSINETFDNLINKFFSYKTLEYYFISLYNSTYRLFLSSVIVGKIKENLIDECYIGLVNDCDVAKTEEMDKCNFGTTTATPEQTTQCQTARSNRTTKCNLIPKEKEDLQESQCKNIYITNNDIKNEINEIISQINSSYINEYYSWDVEYGSDGQCKNKNPNASNECSYAEGTNDVNNSCVPSKQETRSFCQEESKIKEINEALADFTQINNDIGSSDYADTLQPYISKIQNQYNSYKRISKASYDIKVAKNNTYAKNKSIAFAGGISLSQAQSIVEVLRSEWEKVKNDASSFASDNNESGYKDKITKISNLYQKCLNDIEHDKMQFYPLYKTMCGIAGEINEGICTYEDGENEHNIFCSAKNTANNYMSSLKDSNQSGSDRLVESNTNKIENDINELLDNASSNLSELFDNLEQQKEANNKNNNSSVSNQIIVAKTYRGGSPVDYRIEGKAEQGPRLQTGRQNEVVSIMFDPGKYGSSNLNKTDDDFFMAEKNNSLSKWTKSLDSTSGRFNFCNTRYLIDNNNKYPYVSRDGSGSQITTREHLQGGDGFEWLGQGGYLHKYTVDGHKIGHGHSKNDYPDGSFQKDGLLNHGLYRQTIGELSIGKYNVYNQNISSGGAFKHRMSAGAGGRGDVKLDVGAIYIKQLENSQTGNTYPLMDANGNKVISNIEGDQNISSQCVIRCPPIYKKVSDFNFTFADGTDEDMDLLCEYTGKPEDDMEVNAGTTITPSKCYVLSNINTKSYGNIKGKIIRKMGYCPIAKCVNGTWGFTERPTEINKEKYQFDRKTMLCKYARNYQDLINSGSNKKNVLNKNPWYFHMAFDSNIYAGMSFIGGSGTTLSSELFENGNFYNLAECAENAGYDYLDDLNYALEAENLELTCNGGFWYSKVEARKKTPVVLYDDGIKYRTQIFDNHTGGRAISKTDYTDYTERNDEYRNNYYTGNNANMYSTEYLIKEIAKSVVYTNGTAGTTTGVPKIKSAGRQIFKDLIMCPPLIDLYDFDANYSGNASWEATKEHEKAYGTCINRNDGSKYYQQSNGQPYRTCMRNGMWGPVFNACKKGCVPEEDESGNLWDLSSLGENWKPDENTDYVEVYGSCSGNYLNSQNLNIKSLGQATRQCNLITGLWGDVKAGSGCNDGLGCPVDNMDLDDVLTPYFKVINLPNSKLDYQTIVSKMSNDPENYNPNDYIKYNNNLYLIFNTELEYNSITSGDSFVANNDYVDVSYEIRDLSEKNHDSLAYDNKKNRIITEYANDEYVVLFVKNGFSPNAFSYMKTANKNRNAFMSISNWIIDLKNRQKNYTGQWSWDSCNLSVEGSKLIFDTNNTSEEAQEAYKYSSLNIFINIQDDDYKTAKMIAIFSPVLALEYCDRSEQIKGRDRCYFFIPKNERDIKFRYPKSIPTDYQIPKKDPIPVTITTPAGNARVYDILWEKTDISKTRGLLFSWNNQKILTHSPNRNCYGKYIGFIKHNTMKHIFYTPQPTSQDRYFASVFCYDGHIFGYKSFQVGFSQLTDIGTKGCFLKPTGNGDDTAQKIYNYIVSKYPSSVEKESSLYTMEFNSYLAKMAGKYWANFIQPEKQQETFIKKYRDNIDTNSSVDGINEVVKYVLEQYEKNHLGYFYRVVPRPFEWITYENGDASIVDANDLVELDNLDPYCENCNYEDMEDFNTMLSGNIWKTCK